MKNIGFITDDERVFDSRISMLSSYEFCWIKPNQNGEFLELNHISDFDLVIIELKDKGETKDNDIIWLKKIRTYIDIPVIIISRESKSELQAELNRLVGIELPIIEFGKSGVYYCKNDFRLSSLDSIVETALKNKDYGDTQKLLKAIECLRDFRHNGWKRLNGIQLRLETLTDESTDEERKKLVQRMQDIHDKIHSLLQQIREAEIATEQCFPELIEFEEKCATMLNEWDSLTNPSSDKLEYFKKITNIFIQH
jgi:hypothetical protein